MSAQNKIVGIIDRAPSFGAAIAAIRGLKNINQRDLAGLVQISEGAMRDIERNLGLGEPSFVPAFGAALGLSDVEQEALGQRRAREVQATATHRRGECGQCLKGESGWMHVGPGARRDDCRRVSLCLDYVARHFPTAGTCHCARDCGQFEAETNRERLGEAAAHARRSTGEAA